MRFNGGNTCEKKKSDGAEKLEGCWSGNDADLTNVKERGGMEGYIQEASMMVRWFDKTIRSPWPVSATKSPSTQEVHCLSIFSMPQKGGVTHESV